MTTSGTVAASMRRGGVAQIVLLPSGRVGEAVLDRAALWAEEGLLDPVFWVSAESVKEHRTIPARVTAIVMGSAEDGERERREVPLLATLGREVFDEVVVASVRWLSTDHVDAEVVSDAARRLLAAVKDAVPTGRQVGEIVVAGTRVRSLNLVFAATRVQSEELAALISTDWEENILVSPEDRQRPHGADRFTDADDVDAWAGFVAASVATLAGLWTGFSVSPVPRALGSATASEVPQVRVARTFARAVVSGGFSIDLARSVASSLAASQSPLRDHVVAAQIKANNHLVALDGVHAESAIASAVDYLGRVDSSAMTYAGTGVEAPYIPAKVSLGAAVASFGRFSWDKLTAIPTWTQAWFADRAAHKAKAQLFGDESAVEVTARNEFGVAEADRDLMDTAVAVSDMQRAVLSALSQPSIPVTTSASPTLWGALRATVFTLVDGGTDSADIPAIQIDGTIAVVPDMGMVVPAPWDTWMLPPEAAEHLTGSSASQTVVSWTDLPAARQLLEHLTERSADLEMRLHELDMRRAASRGDLITAERDFVEARELWEDLSVELDELQETSRLMHNAGSVADDE